MSNIENLRPIKLTHSQAMEYGKKGGLASGQTRRLNKQIRQTYLLIGRLKEQQVVEIAKEILKNEATEKPRF